MIKNGRIVVSSVPNVGVIFSNCMLKILVFWEGESVMTNYA